MTRRGMSRAMTKALLNKATGAHIAASNSRRVAADPGRFQRMLSLHLRATGITGFVEEYPYTAEVDRKHRADFAWPAHRLLVEVQGGIWKRGGGGHSHPLGIQRDIEKHQLAAILGWRVLPVTTDEVESGRALQVIRKALEWPPPAELVIGTEDEASTT